MSSLMSTRIASRLGGPRPRRSAMSVLCGSCWMSSRRDSSGLPAKGASPGLRSLRRSESLVRRLGKGGATWTGPNPTGRLTNRTPHCPAIPHCIESQRPQFGYESRRPNASLTRCTTILAERQSLARPQADGRALGTSDGLAQGGLLSDLAISSPLRGRYPQSQKTHELWVVPFKAVEDRFHVAHLQKSRHEQAVESRTLPPPDGPGVPDDGSCPGLPAEGLEFVLVGRHGRAGPEVHDSTESLIRADQVRQLQQCEFGVAYHEPASNAMKCQISQRVWLVLWPEPFLQVVVELGPSSHVAVDHFSAFVRVLKHAQLLLDTG